MNEKLDDINSKFNIYKRNFDFFFSQRQVQILKHITNAAQRKDKNI